MNSKGIIILVIVITVLFLLEVMWGSVTIPLESMIDLLAGNEIKESWEKIILNVRVPRAITALWVGCGLAVAGLLMQTLFRNPLAGPYVLGISSGASLGVAMVMFVGQGFSMVGIMKDVSIVGGAFLGAVVMLAIIISVAGKVRSSVSLLLVGLMAGIFVNGIVSVLQFFAESNVLQSYVIWTMGSLSVPTGNSLWALMVCVLVVMAVGYAVARPLNALLMGEEFAKETGVNIKSIRFLIIIGASLVVAMVTAYCGPIAFIGIAAPQITKRWFKTGNHRYLILPAALTGGAMLLLCDWLSQLPGSSYTIPINAVASLLGAPIVIWVVLTGKHDFEF